ncbi:MAG: rhodanese-like domain-containing protein [Magnetococcales bacterium]|nr:rhodanese-like domain-containing protein [Magnetococcales bacterium]
MKTFAWIVVVFGLIFSATTLQAGEHPEVPLILEGIPVVDSQQVLELMEGGDTLFVDARKRSDYQHGTIPGAINCRVTSGAPELSPSEVEQTLQDFKSCPDINQADPSQRIVVFCNGVHCWRSGKGALALEKIGFLNILWYRAGMNDWKRLGLPME